ncbi:uncharacterized protein BT62DRAFT_1081384 [Guyanagaster necrorhizus]|uniref:Uncharacterized protein n=1 Tax=Guyanagaster necrorhizus TaxID=856835 RepID=A0A9P8AL08_9AGAR|nr:uncharacterized protein BT62DRAFT_1081384 [Guyanagaster necrorhizus MCA 3950]KAG7439743.1 hypothetical protein BT62DRAFT_1081384 [Guyanagaster necrorhizus MCA 3950]
MIELTLNERPQPGYMGIERLKQHKRMFKGGGADEEFWLFESAFQNVKALDDDAWVNCTGCTFVQILSIVALRIDPRSVRLPCFPLARSSCHSNTDFWIALIYLFRTVALPVCILFTAGQSQNIRRPQESGTDFGQGDSNLKLPWSRQRYTLHNNIRTIIKAYFTYQDTSLCLQPGGVWLTRHHRTKRECYGFVNLPYPVVNGFVFVSVCAVCIGLKKTTTTKFLRRMNGGDIYAAYPPKFNVQRPTFNSF